VEHISDFFKNAFNQFIKLMASAANYATSYLPDLIAGFISPFTNIKNFPHYNAYEIVKGINAIWNTVVLLLFAYFAVYTVVGLFATKKFPKAKNNHKYAILIAARNEEKVIGNLLDSIKKQDYPSELLTVFVVADNCTDNTAAVARKYGAVCYERFDETNKTKGFALQFLFDHINEDYGIQSFEGYFIFDADNLLKSDYITRMNEAFDSGEKIITSFRNTKNIDDNWISASYGLHWLRTTCFAHRARSVFNLATNIQGTGFLFSNELVKDGWKYTSLTEDRAFTADAVVQGYSITYNDAAEFYDEQPVSLKVAFRQRIRWCKGHILAFVESGGKLFKNIFCAKGFRNKFMSYDMLMFITPRALFSFARRIIEGIVFIIVCHSDLHSLSFLGYNIPFPDFAGSGIVAGALQVLLWRLSWIIASYWFPMMLQAVVPLFTERKRIEKIKWYKKVWYIFIWPVFDLIGVISTYIALFVKVTWKPIPHDSEMDIDRVSAQVSGENKK